MTVAVVGALLAGWASGGSLDRLGRLPVRGWPLVLLGVLAQVVGALVGGAAYPVGLVLGVCCVGAFLVRHLRMPGMALITLGLLLNAIVVAANGAMPVSLFAAARAGAQTGPIAAGADPRHELAGGDTVLSPLGDVVPVPLPWLAQVVSPGDCLVAAGVGLLVYAGMRRREDGEAGSAGAEPEPAEAATGHAPGSP